MDKKVNIISPISPPIKQIDGFSRPNISDMGDLINYSDCYGAFKMLFSKSSFNSSYLFISSCRAVWAT